MPRLKAVGLIAITCIFWKVSSLVNISSGNCAATLQLGTRCPWGAKDSKRHSGDGYQWGARCEVHGNCHLDDSRWPLGRWSVVAGIVLTCTNHLCHGFILLVKGVFLVAHTWIYLGYVNIGNHRQSMTIININHSHTHIIHQLTISKPLVQHYWLTIS